MESLLTKERLIKTIQDLPEGFTTEDVIERIIVLGKIEEAMEQVRKGDVIDDEDLDKHLPEWLV